MTQEEQDEKEFDLYWWNRFPHSDLTQLFWLSSYQECKLAFLVGRRTLMEKIKSDPSIGKLEVEE